MPGLADCMPVGALASPQPGDRPFPRAPWMLQEPHQGSRDLTEALLRKHVVEAWVPPHSLA